MAGMLHRNARSRVPWGALFAGGLGVAAVVRALYHPKRVVLDGATALHCAGEADCDPAMTLRSSSGGGPVYAMAPGVVVAVGPDSVAIAASDEAVVLDYTSLYQVQVVAGQRVGLGQQIGLGKTVRFAVYDAQSTPDGKRRDSGSSPLGKPYEPASWLAVHGLRASGRTVQPQWCEEARRLSVPQQVAKCGMQLPVPSAWALLPVRVSLTQ